MPRTDKIKTRIEDMLSVFREVYLTIPEARYLWESVYDFSVASLMSGKVVNLFNIVFLELVERQEVVQKNAFGITGNLVVVPKRYVVKSRVHPKFHKSILKALKE